MVSTLSPSAAKELGRTLRFVRTARELTLRDVANGAGLSPQYVYNIERGQRVNVAEDAYLRLGTPLAVPEEVLRDLLLRARIVSLLEQHGLAADDVAFIWRGVEDRLRERGRAFDGDIARVVTEALR